MSIIKSKDTLSKINKNTDDAPWYFGRKFWGVLVGLSFLPSLMFVFYSLYKISFTEKIISFFQYLSVGFYIIMLNRMLHIEIPSRWGIYYIILYYIISGLLFYLTFRNKKVKIIFPILIIGMLWISTVGFWVILAFSS
ncbi:MAG: hypothetical protein Q8P20_01585 [bacterium]|nr:hypothetical protein [bacterium]